MEKGFDIADLRYEGSQLFALIEALDFADDEIRSTIPAANICLLLALMNQQTTEDFGFAVVEGLVQATLDANCVIGETHCVSTSIASRIYVRLTNAMCASRLVKVASSGLPAIDAYNNRIYEHLSSRPRLDDKDHQGHVYLFLDPFKYVRQDLATFVASVFYIGCSTTQKRLLEHADHAMDCAVGLMTASAGVKSHLPVHKRVAYIWSRGGYPIVVKLLDNLVKTEAFLVESLAIKQFSSHTLNEVNGRKKVDCQLNGLAFSALELLELPLVALQRRLESGQLDSSQRLEPKAGHRRHHQQLLARAAEITDRTTTDSSCFACERPNALEHFKAGSICRMCIEWYESWLANPTAIPRCTSPHQPTYQWRIFLTTTNMPYCQMCRFVRVETIYLMEDV